MAVYLPHLSETIYGVLLLMFIALCLYRTFLMLRTFTKGLAPAIQIMHLSIPSMLCTDETCHRPLFWPTANAARQAASIIEKGFLYSPQWQTTARPLRREAAWNLE